LGTTGGKQEVHPRLHAHLKSLILSGDADGSTILLQYLGRIDSQVKVRGHRVELQEIDYALRQASGAEQVMSVAWPMRDGSADGVVAFLAGGASVNEDSVLGHCRRVLPDYMVPRQIHRLERMPLNVNGKIDRSKLIQLLEGIA